MRLEIKSIDTNPSLEDIARLHISDIAVLVTILVGFEGEEGGDYFDFSVYSMAFLEKHTHLPQYLDKAIVVKSFCLEELIVCINKIVGGCNDVSDIKSLEKVAQYFRWEFDGYAPYEE